MIERASNSSSPSRLPQYSPNSFSVPHCDENRNEEDQGHEGIGETGPLKAHFVSKRNGPKPNGKTHGLSSEGKELDGFGCLRVVTINDICDGLTES